MDWTGGTRRRFAASKKNALLQNQKSHFAKARAISQNPRSSRHSSKPSLTRSIQRPDRSTHQRSKSRERERRPPSWHDNKRSASNHFSLKNSDDLRDTRSAKQTSQRRKSEVMYISSSAESSVTESLAPHHQLEKKETIHPRKTVHSIDMPDEERLLLAKRRKLLARTDWLGLAALKPIYMQFPASVDKDCIGKRRKIRSSASRKGKPAEQKKLPSLFERPLSQHEFMMSGALPRDDIQIKIGTDALVSQTQRSRHSQTPRRTSVRPMSSEFGPLSEEYMLLGPEGDDLESTVLQDQTSHTVNASRAQAQSLQTIDEQQTGQHQHHVPYTPEIGPILSKAGILQEFYGQQEPSHAFQGKSIGVMPEFDYLRSAHEAPHLPMDRDEPQLPLHDFSNYSQRAIEGYWDRVMQSPPLQQLQDSIHGENGWRRLLKIDPMNSSRHSIAALKSSSLHNTTWVSSDCRVMLDQTVRDQENNEQGVSLLEHASTDAGLGTGPGRAIEGTTERGSTNLQSPSASLQQITKLADRHAGPARQTEEETKGEALWREFIVGSQDSCDSLSHRERSASRDGADPVLPAHASSAFNISGLGTSVKSTIGDSFFAPAGSSRATPHTLSKHRRNSSFQTREEKNHTQTSDEGGKCGNCDEEDPIEDDILLTVDAVQARNIRAATTSILNPKRFKHSAKKTLAAKRNPSRFRHSGPSKTGATVRHSVYDLVDSDGRSVGR